MSKQLIVKENGEFLRNLKFEMKGILPTVTVVWTSDRTDAFVANDEAEALQVISALRAGPCKKSGALSFVPLEEISV